MPRGRQTDLLSASRAAALAELGYSSTQIEALTGVNARTVWGILNNEASWGEIKERPVFKANRIKQKEALEAATRVLAGKCLIEAEKKLDKVSAYQAVGMYGILRQNERLDAGEPTLNLTVSTKDQVAGLDQFCKLLSQALLSDQAIDVTPQNSNDATE